MVKTLIFTQCFLKTEAQGRLMATSIKLMERLNPGVDILLIDNASPIDPRIPLGGDWSDLSPVLLDDAGNILEPLYEPARRSIAVFREAIGHFHYDKHNMVAPRDGPGRAIMTALKIAALSGYDRAAYMESDCLFALPLQWGWDRMVKPCACEPRIPYGYLDWQCWWIRDLQWLVNEFDFPARYDWPNRKPDWMGDLCGELIYEQILGDHLEALPLRGGRGDAIKLTRGKLREMFPTGCDFLTHADVEDFATFLEMNGHADLVQLLA